MKIINNHQQGKIEMKTKLFFMIAFVLIISIPNSYAQNKIDILKQILSQDSQELTELLGQYRFADLLSRQNQYHLLCSNLSAIQVVSKTCREKLGVKNYCQCQHFRIRQQAG